MAFDGERGAASSRWPTRRTSWRIDDIGLMTGYEVRPAVASRDDIRRAGQRPDPPRRRRPRRPIEEAPRTSAAEVVDLRETADDAPVIKLVNQIIAQAVELGASDIHFEPGTASCACASASTACCPRRRRVPRRMVAGVVSRVKIMSDLDIAERRLPQDGRVGLTIDGHTSTCASSRCPASTARAIVMRILDKSNVVARPRQARHGRRGARALRARDPPALRRRARHRPDGLRQVDVALRGARARSTRPRRTSSRSRTRSSTSSTGITQVQVNPKAGLTFANGLRSMMRADPDIIMVGEIRDARDGADRHRGRPHRPPRALDAAHERRAERRSRA